MNESTATETKDQPPIEAAIEILQTSSVFAKEWHDICATDALIENAGVCALLSDQRQVAIFYLPDTTPALYAIENFDPVGGANVIYRGIIGSKENEPVVASPLFKQQYSLVTGQCIQQTQLRLATYAIRIVDQKVQLFI